MKVARLLLETATTIAKAINARSIIVAVDGLPEMELVPPRTILAVRDAVDAERAERLASSAQATIEVPNVELDRMGQVKLAAIIALSYRVIELHDTVVFLAGPFRSMIDSLTVMTMGAEYELLDTTEQPDIDEHIKRAVFYRVLSLSLQIGQHGREGKKVGALFVLGDRPHVAELSEQMIMNPFKGYPEKERNILDDSMSETVKEYCAIDGAFLIRGNGVIDTAGARLKAGLSEGLPSGLGARHAAAAGITAATKSIAITVSQSDGTVRVWRAGKMLASFDAAPR